AETAPPGNPFSAVHSSRTYWESARFGSIACTAWSEHKTARPASSAALRKVLELLKDDLGLLLDRHRRIAEHVEIDPDRLTARRRHAGREVTRRERRRRAGGGGGRRTEGAERDASRLPAEHVREPAGGGAEAEDVGRHVVRLDQILRVLVRGD